MAKKLLSRPIKKSQTLAIIIDGLNSFSPLKLSVSSLDNPFYFSGLRFTADGFERESRARVRPSFCRTASSTPSSTSATTSPSLKITSTSKDSAVSVTV